MQEKYINIGGSKVTVLKYNTIIIGSGAAGLNAANSLYRLGQKEIAIITEGIRMGTSRNTGSDKQTYYKLSTAGNDEDSVRKMAQTLFDGGSMDGDIALAEAALSMQAFYHLVDIGVPFPFNNYGEYVGYKTDHDPCMRGTSAGPLTSRYMVKLLFEEVKKNKIPIYDGYQVIEILTASEESKKKAVGVIALNKNQINDEENRYVIFSATNVIYATGGEAGMYKTSVYPGSQTGGTGTAFRAGICGKNLTESQYGIASIKFRWNLSGTFQQVIPRYVSTDMNGNDEKEFLDDYFEEDRSLLNAIFLKGYQWPFDPRKVSNNGSSMIDIVVYNETVLKGRRVFLDFTQNPSALETNGDINFSKLGQEAQEYLAKSNTLLDTPIARLEHMNKQAVELYRNHGIDLYHEKLEIAMCAQHNNGGLGANKWWESNITHFFPIGEANGSHGIYRPGGSALNSGQVGGIRASQYIASNYTQNPKSGEELCEICKNQIRKSIQFGEKALASKKPLLNLKKERFTLGERMTKYGAQIRSYDGVVEALDATKKQLDHFEKNRSIENPRNLINLYRIRDLLVSQYVYLTAIKDYIEVGGKSRGSYMIFDSDGHKPSINLPDAFKFSLDNGILSDKIQEIKFNRQKCRVTWRSVRPIPDEDNWFENVWKSYTKGDIFK